MRKIAIIGTAPGSRAVAPFNDPEWTIWACSQGNQGHLPRVDAWFELHAMNFFKTPTVQAWSIPYLGWLRSQTFPVYMQEKNDFVPQAIVFPYRRMIELFGRQWFTSSVAWMMAYAISQMREGDVIGLFGVDMAAGMEHYTAQRAGCYRFIELAKEKGIAVTTPHESCLGQNVPLYGYSEATRFGFKAHHRLMEMKSHRAELVAQRDKLAMEIAFADGMIENAEYVMRTFLDGEDAELDLPMPEVKNIALDAPPAPRPATTGDFEQQPSGVYMPKKPNGAARHEKRED